MSEEVLPIENDDTDIDESQEEDLEIDELEEKAANEEPPAPERKPEPEPDEYDHDADLNLQSALRLITAAGIPEDGIEMYAASHGDFERLSDALRGNKDRDLILRLVKSSYDAFMHAEERRTARITSEIEDFAGGKKAWADMRKWAESNASPEELADMKAAIEMGGPAARLLVRLLKQVRNAPKAEANDAEVAEESRKPRVSRREREALTPAVINRRIGDLYAKYGTAATRTPEYRALMNAIN